MNRFAFAVAVVASIGFVSGCAAPSPTPSASPSFDADWVLATASDSLGNLDLTGDAIRLTIQDGQVSGQICNSWGGDITVDGSSVVIGPLAATEMYCTEPSGIMDRETRVLSDLPLVTRIELVDGGLHLSGGGVDMTFVGAY